MPMATALPIGFRPSALEVKMVRRAVADLGCSKSDLLRTALRSFLSDLSRDGLVTLPAKERPALARLYQLCPLYTIAPSDE